MTSQVPRVRNLGAAWLDGSGFGSVMRLLPCKDSAGTAGSASRRAHVAVDRLPFFAGHRLEISVPYCVDLSPGMFRTWQPASPRLCALREKNWGDPSEGSHRLLLSDLGSDTPPLLLVRSNPISPAHTLRSGIKLHLLKGGVPKNVWTYF